jgi:hypothetical protein
VRNHYSQWNQEPQVERALTINQGPNLPFQSTVSVPIICLPASYCRGLIYPIILRKQDEDTDLDIGNDESKGKSDDMGESIVLSEIEEHDLSHQLHVLLPGQAHWDKLLETTRVPLPKKQRHTDTVSSHPLFPNS